MKLGIRFEPRPCGTAWRSTRDWPLPDSRFGQILILPAPAAWCWGVGFDGAERLDGRWRRLVAEHRSMCGEDLDGHWSCWTVLGEREMDCVPWPPFPG